MPEEINRIVTDALADALWAPSPDAVDNLLAEGVARARILLVGNIMIDCLEMVRAGIERRCTYREYGQTERSYGVVTIHRPSNVDHPAVLRELCGMLERVSARVPLIFPVHPRTRQRIATERGLTRAQDDGRLFVTQPLGYSDFMSLVLNARLVITDSGGIQEETTYLGIPCLTMRENTERPITVTQGTNRLCAPSDVPRLVNEILRTNVRTVPRIEFWDGKTAGRVVQGIRREMSPVMKLKSEACGVEVSPR
jgi:UDP-N-acetylglucosamine 2-epimerase (non-hydrolysing)